MRRACIRARKPPESAANKHDTAHTRDCIVLASARQSHPLALQHNAHLKRTHPTPPLSTPRFGVDFAVRSVVDERPESGLQMSGYGDANERVMCFDGAEQCMFH